MSKDRARELRGKAVDEKTLQEIFAFMGEMRSERDHRDQLLELQSERLRAMEEKMADTDEKVDGLITKIGRWESKFGTLMFIGSCLWAAFMTFKDEFVHFMKG